MVLELSQLWLPFTVLLSIDLAVTPAVLAAIDRAWVGEFTAPLTSCVYVSDIISNAVSQTIFLLLDPHSQFARVHFKTLIYVSSLILSNPNEYNMFLSNLILLSLWISYRNCRRTLTRLNPSRVSLWRSVWSAAWNVDSPSMSIARTCSLEVTKGCSII